MQNMVALGCYSDGSGFGGKQIGGLQLLVADNPTTGIVGGIDRASTIGSFYRNQKWSVTTDGGVPTGASKDNITHNMNSLWAKLCRGAEKPDLIVADNKYFIWYLESLQGIQRITQDNTASAGYDSLKYMSADVVMDGGYGGGCPADHMYFINSNYLYFRPHSARNFVPIGNERFATNQDAMVKLIGWAGQMTLSCAFLQGVLTN